MINNIKQYWKIIFISILFVGCADDFLDTGPSTQVSETDAFKTTQTTAAVLRGIIRQWRTLSTFGGLSMSSSGLTSVLVNREVMGPDVLVRKSWWRDESSYSSYNQTNNRTAFNWRLFYIAINNANNVLANVDAAEGTQAEKDKIRGDALALRAYSYFELINTYAPTYSRGAALAGVPIYLEPTTAATTGNPRATVAEVYTQILADLTAARALLTGSRTAKAYMNSNVVDGYLARTYMMMGNYSSAATSANSARQGYPLMSESDWASGFRDIGNAEWIWGQDNNANENPDWGSAVGQFDVENGGTESSLHISDALFNLYSNTDIRKSVIYDNGGFWGSRKFQVGSPQYSVDYPYMRSSEMYLIEAEALARTAQEAAASTLLLEVQQSRDASAVASGNTGQALIDEILLEKRKELWGEGVYFLDMLRNGLPLDRDPLHIAPLNIPANSWSFIFPLPESEFLINTSINFGTDQNPLTGTF